MNFFSLLFCFVSDKRNLHVYKKMCNCKNFRGEMLYFLEIKPRGADTFGQLFT